jgi:hypothetical protein
MHRLKDISPGKLAVAISMVQKYTRAVLENEGRTNIADVTEAEGSMAYNHGILAATLSLALSPKELDLFTKILNRVNELCQAEIKATKLEAGKCAD